MRELARTYKSFAIEVEFFRCVDRRDDCWKFHSPDSFLSFLDRLRAQRANGFALRPTLSQLSRAVGSGRRAGCSLTPSPRSRLPGDRGKEKHFPDPARDR